MYSLEQMYDARMSSEEYPLVKVWNPKKGYDEWVESHPDACANGHDWTKPESMTPGWHDMHRTWRCLTPGCDAPTIVKTDDDD